MKKGRFVYFIKPVGLPGPIKIGASNDVELRLRQQMAWSPLPLELLATIEGGFQLEWRLHALLHGSRLHHEWFAPTDELLAIIAAIHTGTFDEAALPAPLNPSQLTHDRLKAHALKMGEAGRAVTLENAGGLQ